MSKFKPHNHACQRCQWEWECYTRPKGIAMDRWTFNTCQVTKTAAAMGEGPFCDLCRTLKEIQRHIKHRFKMTGVPHHQFDKLEKIDEAIREWIEL